MRPSSRAEAAHGPRNLRLYRAFRRLVPFAASWPGDCATPGMGDALHSRRNRAGFPHWEGRIAPLFDTAREIRVVETDGTRLVAAHDEALPAGPAERRAARLTALGIGTLVCGAISRETGRAVEAAGVHVVPFVSGELGTVVRAFLDGELAREDFRMPGCGGGRRRRFRGGDGRAGGGTCSCPACGHSEPHVRGVPCVSTACPRCGAALTRSR